MDFSRREFLKTGLASIDAKGMTKLDTYTVRIPCSTPFATLSEADGRSVADLERLRDGFLAELLELVERYAVTGRGDALLPVAAAGPTAAALG